MMIAKKMSSKPSPGKKCCMLASMARYFRFAKSLCCFLQFTDILLLQISWFCISLFSSLKDHKKIDIPPTLADPHFLKLICASLRFRNLEHFRTNIHLYKMTSHSDVHMALKCLNILDQCPVLENNTDL